MNSACKLPVNDAPPVYSYLHHAFPLSMLSVDDRYLPWLHSNYIQLSADPEYFRQFADLIFVNFYHPVHIHHYHELLQNSLITTDLLDQTTEDIVAFFKGCIRRGQYIYLFLNEFYIPGKALYQKHHFAHDILLFGYDDSSEVFHTLGFKDNHEYGQTAVSYAGLRESYHHTDRPYNWMKEIALLRADDQHAYAFDRQQVIEALEDYVLSRNSSERYRQIRNPNRHIYGIGVYGELVKYLELLLNIPGTQINIIPFHVLWEHKKCMLARFEYMEQQQIYTVSEARLEQYRTIEREAYEIRKQFYKFAYFLREDVRIVGEIIIQLRRLASFEAEVLGSIAGDMRSGWSGG